MNDTEPQVLLELYLLGELDAAEARRVEAWLAEHPERRADLQAAHRTLQALERTLVPPPETNLVAERVIALLPHRRPRPHIARLLRLAGAAAAAAAAVLSLTVLALPRRNHPRPDLARRQPAGTQHATAHRYPEPRAEGTYLVSTGDTLSRGSLVRAGAGGALIELGGYCRLELAPDSVVRISGTERQESVFLEEGMVACDVDRNVGAFAVETEFCTVSALGTKFIVQLRKKGGEEEPGAKEAYVRVLAGAALVTHPWGQDLLVAR